MRVREECGVRMREECGVRVREECGVSGELCCELVRV